MVPLQTQAQLLSYGSSTFLPEFGSQIIEFTYLTGGEIVLMISNNEKHSNVQREQESTANSPVY